MLVKDKRLEIVRDKLIDSEAEKFELITWKPWASVLNLLSSAFSKNTSILNS